MMIKPYVRILFFFSFLIFVVNKLFLRNLVIEYDLPNAFQVLVFSLPNFVEAVLGMTVITGIIFQFRKYANGSIKEVAVYMISTILTALYVISQELGYHAMGGNNVYDKYDLIASISGLILMFVTFTFFGFSSNNEIEERPG